MGNLRLPTKATGLLSLTLATIACGGSDDADHTPGESPAVEVAGPALGERAEIVLPNDSSLGGSGFAVVVRRVDGSRVPALFRGPSKFAQQASGGDYEFHEDSLPSRVRLLGPGEELRRPGGHLP